MSALSILQDAQTARGIAAIGALANMKYEHDEMNKNSVSPSNVVGTTLPTDIANLYAGLFTSAHGSPMGMLTPTQMLAANQTAAALMAARLAPNFYPHHLFGSWHLPPNNTSPPISPISPALSVKSVKKINNNNNIVSTTTNELMPNNNNLTNINNNLTNTNNNNNLNIKNGKALITTAKKTGGKRKASVKKELLSPPGSHVLHHLHHPFGMDIQQLGHDIHTGPISPPISGSSPQSTGSIEHQSPSSSSVIATTAKDPTRDKVFTCKICNRSFGYKHVLQNHERTHTGEKPFACPECNKRFTRDHHLKTHLRLHTGEKPYHCEHCDRKFVQVANLRRHTRVHTGEKPYKCESCQTKFSDSNQLKAHMLIHNDEKPFKCDSCHSRFRRRHHLGNHKCSINSPPTPAMSPAMSIGNKSASSRSDVSEHSLELSQQAATVIKHLHLTQGLKLQQQHQHQQQQQQQQQQQSQKLQIPQYTTTKIEVDTHQMPLDLSMEDVTDCSEKRNRKSHDVRRILRMPTQIMQIETDQPEQTEPEDLSMHSPRSASPISNEDDLDELDDAESLYRRHSRNHLNPNCGYCDEKFDKIELLKQHLHIKHTILPICSLPPPSPTDL